MHRHAQHRQLEAGDLPLAIARLRAHIGSVSDHLGRQALADDPLAPLRAALMPLKAPAASPTGVSADAAGAPRARRRRLFTDLVPPRP